MPNPVCLKCQRFYRPEKNGVFWLEQMPKSNGAPQGTEAPDQWEPYKIWVADLWKCRGCGHELITGHAPRPVSEHYMPNFSEWLENWGARRYIVNDC